MKVCVLGEESEQLDEGMKNTSVQLRDTLDGEHDVRLFDLRDVDQLSFWRGVLSFRPDVLHLVPGPTLQGLVLLKLLSVVHRCPTVATATQPRFSDRSWELAKYVRPDRLLAQSDADEEWFRSAGYRTERLPSGVDLDRFEPVSPDEQASIRADLGLDPDERVFLHVGHFKEGRNLRSLVDLLEFGTVVVVGSPSTGPQETLIEDLRDAGCVVQTDYVEEIHRYYQASDWYVFPVLDDGNSIRAPLSVLEAMACDLPVLATRFGALTDMFDEGDGVRFVSDASAVDDATLDSVGPVETREKVRPYAWKSIAERVADVYSELCNKDS